MHELSQVFRFVDRDMLMRYHWGLAVGHVYSHARWPNIPANSITESSADEWDAMNEDVHESRVQDQDATSNTDSDWENPELGFENREDDCIDSGEDPESEPERVDDGDDELFVAIDDMYGFADY
jgi:hypothetical protein